MRAPFPFESNGFLLSKFLVPEPVSRIAWDEAEASWREDPQGESLIGRIIRLGLLDEEGYLGAMSQGLGVPVVREMVSEEASAGTGETHLLRQFGFVILPGHGGKQRLAGGPDLPPDLGRYLGTEAGKWEWVMIAPHQVHGKPGQPERSPGLRVGGIPNPGLTPTGEWLDQVLETSQAQGVSDLHLERSRAGLQVRMRTPAGMQTLGHWPPEFAVPATRLLKEWSGIPTSDYSLPSDRRLQRTIGSRRHVFRVSHLGTVDGESLVLRRLSARASIRSPDELGIPGELQSELDAGIHCEHGILLFTGPTGSGKTTTLFSFLSRVANTGLKIMTIEDPVEYDLPGAIQSQVDEANGWTFDRAGRAFLRQDPDILVLGELRDRFSAEAACRAALTGHTVLATLHARCETSALDRLYGWGISRILTGEVVRLIVNQRLEPTGPDGRSRTARFTWRRMPLQDSRPDQPAIR